jgi:hypothetical protein
MAYGLGVRTILGIYGNHMNGWWAWMTIAPVLLILILALVVYVAVRLGVRDGKRDS